MNRVKRKELIELLKNISTDKEWLIGVVTLPDKDEEYDKIISYVEKNYKGAKFHNDDKKWDDISERVKTDILTKAILISYGKY